MKTSNYQLLKDMCEVHAPSGNEVNMKEFILDYIKEHSKNWKHQPKVIHGKEFQDNIILVLENHVPPFLPTWIVLALP